MSGFLNQYPAPEVPIQTAELPIKEDPKKFNHKLYLAVGALVLVIASIWIYFAYFSSVPNENEYCKEIADRTSRAFCNSVLENDTSFCKKLDEPYRLTCRDELTEISSKIGEVSFCDTDWGYGEARGIVDKYNCLLKFAKAQNDILLCPKVGASGKRECYLYFAKSFGSPKVCDILAEVEDVGECYGEITSWVRGYATDPEEELMFLSTMNDETVCNNADGLANRYFCMAVATRNLSFCSLFGEEFPDYANGCFSIVAALKKEVSLCLEDDCLRYIAVTTHDSSYCFNLSTQLNTGSCLYKMAQANNDSRACQKIVAQRYGASKDGCIYKLALKLKDVSLCNDLEDNDLKDKCLSNFKPFEEKLATCKAMKVENTVWDSYQHSCYKDALLGDISWTNQT